MANSTSIFNNYVEEGSKLSSLKDFFSVFESIGGFIKSLKGAYSEVTGKLTGLYDKLKNSTYLSDWLSKLGLSSDALALVNKYTGGLLTAADSALGDMLDVGLAALKSYGNSILGEITAGMGMDEDVFLTTVKTLYNIGSDPNYDLTLYNVAIAHDMPKVLEWLDGINGVTYDIDSPKADVALTAASMGSFHVSKYIMDKMSKAHVEITASPAYTTEEIKTIKDYDLRYKKWFVQVFKSVFLNSYGNLTPGELLSFLDEPKYYLKAAHLGTSDVDYFKEFAITENDLDIIAPLYPVTYDYALGQKDETYILPKNRNVKKNYVLLVEMANFPLESKLLHDRLLYPLYTADNDALHQLTNTFANSTVGQYLKKAKDQYLSMISQFARKCEPILFSPASYNLKSWSDTTMIPDFIETATSQDNTVINGVPVPSVMTKYGVDFSDFSVVETPANMSLSTLTSKVLNDVTKNPSLKYKYDASTSFVSFDSYESTTVSFQILYTDNANLIDDDDIWNEVIKYVIAKYIVDKYKLEENPRTINELVSAYPDLRDELIFFTDYYNGVPVVDTAETNPEDADYYEGVINEDGTTSSVTDTGVVITDPAGNTRIDNAGLPTGASPIGITNIDGNTVIAVMLPSGEIAYYVKNPITGEYVLLQTGGEAPDICPGTGVANTKNIIFYKAIYYGGVYFIIDTKNDSKKLFVVDNLESSNVVATINVIGHLNLPDCTIDGISVLADGYIYMVIGESAGVYRMKLDADYNITTIERLSDIPDDVMIKTTGIGTLLSAADINYDNEYDINIDDAKIRSSIRNYYSKKIRQFWYLKLDKGTITLNRVNSVEYTPSNLFKVYNDENDPSARIEHDYLGNDTVHINGTADYKPSPIFERYLEEAKSSS